MENLVVNLITVGVSILGAAVICGLTFGRLQGKVEGVIFRLNRIETEHSQVMTGLADVKARVEDSNKLLTHLIERVDRLVEKIPVRRTGEGM